MNAQTICVHGDTPGAAQIAAAIREKLLQAGITPKSLMP
jgi:lactam utilization protein B